MEDLKTLRVRLQYWRTRRAKTIRQLAKDAGVSSSTIVKIENNPHHMPRPDVINRLAQHLHVSVDELVVDDEEKPAVPVPAA